MSFGDTFWKVWQVRTSIKIQESIENFLDTSNQYLNANELTSALIKNNISWNQKLTNSRKRVEEKVFLMSCEFCSSSFQILKTRGLINAFSGFVYYDKIAYRSTEQVVENVTERFNLDLKFRPFFYCSKKCLLNDTSIVLNQII